MESNIHLIRTDKPSRLIKNNLGYGIVSDIFKQSDLDLIQAQYQNIYITSDEEIKARDWCYHIELKDDKVDRCYQVTKYHTWTNNGVDKTRKFKKIILTTDDQLIQDGVQSIDDEFLQWFVKNPSCERVEVQNDYLIWKNSEKENLSDCYKIIIPQETPKQKEEDER
jgi:hypothetical protein